VVEGNLAKFGVGLDVGLGEKQMKLRKRLLGTGKRELVEAAKNDRTWGVGFDEANAEENRESWGQNLLGKALMEVRERFRDDESMRRDGEENVEKMEERGQIHNGRK